MICRICEKEIPDQSNFCPVCGTRQTRSHCINCGKPLLTDARYCPNCGIVVYKPSHEKTVQLQKKRKRKNTFTVLLLFLAFLAAAGLTVLLLLHDGRFPVEIFFSFFSR